MKSSILNIVKIVYLFGKSNGIVLGETLQPHKPFFPSTICSIAYYFSYIQLVYQVRVKARKTRYSGLAWRFWPYSTKYHNLLLEWMIPPKWNLICKRRHLGFLWFGDCTCRPAGQSDFTSGTRNCIATEHSWLHKVLLVPKLSSSPGNREALSKGFFALKTLLGKATLAWQSDLQFVP